MKLKLHAFATRLVGCVRAMLSLMTKTKRAKQITASVLTALIIVISIFILEIPNVYALTVGPNPGTTATGSSWTSVANAEACSSTYATLSVSNGATGGAIVESGYGFSIPTGSTIDGIQADYHRLVAATSSKASIEDATVQLEIGGVASGTNLATTAAWTATNTDTVYGGASTLWGLTPTVAQVNATSFGITVAPKNVKISGSGASLTAEVDCVDLSITYTPPAVIYKQAAYQFYSNQNGTYANGTSWTQATTSDGFSSGVMNGQGLSFNGYMWLLGGQYGATATYLNSVACSSDGITWDDVGCGTTGAAWTGRSMFGAVVFNNKMWVLGGMASGGSPVANVYCSSDGTTWSDTTCGTTAAPWGTRYGLSAVVFNNKIYVIAGNNGTSTLNDVWSSSDGANWTEVTAGSCSTACANSFTARSNAQVLVSGGKLYIMGGFNGSTYYNDVWSSTDGSTWTQVTANGTGGNAPWSGRGNVAGQVYNGDMWVMGGWNGTTYLNDVWCSADGINWYDSTTGGQCGGTSAASWSGRNAPVSVVYNSRMWVIGGKTATSTWNSDVWYSALPAIGVGSTLAATDTAITSPVDNQPFRLRMDVNISNVSLAANGQNFRLQYAPLSGSCAASSYSDVTSTSPVSYYTNSVAASNQDISSTFPTDPATPTGYVAENYQQSNNDDFTNTYAVSTGYDGVWDFALTTQNTTAGTSYCLRIAQDTSGVVSGINTYTNYPEITTPAYGLGQSSFRFYKNQDAASAGGGWTQATTSGTNYASALGRYQGTSLVYNNKMWMLGGYNNVSLLLNSVYSSSDGSNWTQSTAAAGWTARGEFAAVTFNNEMWIMGGFDSGSQYKHDVWCSSDGTNWSDTTCGTSSAPWAARQGLRAVSFNGKMYVMGGYDGTNEYNDVWSSSDGTNWTENTSSALWGARDDPCVLVYNNKIWVMGGENSNTGLANNEVWSSSDGTNWSAVTVNAQWHTRFASQCIVANGKMYVMGGYDTAIIGYDADVWTSTDGSNWTADASPSWGARAYGGGLTFNNSIWVLGGYGNGATLNDGWYLPSSAIDVGSPLAEQNMPIEPSKFDDTGGTPTNLTGVPFRLRWNISNTGGGAAASGLSLTLQYAEEVGGSCVATGTSGTWASVSATTPVQFYTGNTNATNGDTLIPNANDPTDGSNFINYQTFNTANPASNTQSAIYLGQDGLWDFPLTMASNVPHANYCLRIYDSTKSSAITSNNEYPEIDMGPTMTQLLRGRSWWNASGVREYKDL